jgi:hypothetical protein
MRRVADITSQSPHLSLFRRRVARIAGQPVELHSWLIDEANRRGYFGAFNRVRAEGLPTSGIMDEEVVVALLMPDAEADGRTWKLVVRMLQAGRLNPTRLSTLARRERADVMLQWLLEKVPSSERCPPLNAVQAALRAPRHVTPVAVVWDASRLVRQPLIRGTEWRRKPS